VPFSESQSCAYVRAADVDRDSDVRAFPVSTATWRTRHIHAHFCLRRTSSSLVFPAPRSCRAWQDRENPVTSPTPQQSALQAPEHDAPAYQFRLKEVSTAKLVLARTIINSIFPHQRLLAVCRLGTRPSAHPNGVISDPISHVREPKGQVRQRASALTFARYDSVCRSSCDVHTNGDFSSSLRRNACKIFLHRGLLGYPQRRVVKSFREIRRTIPTQVATLQPLATNHSDCCGSSPVLRYVLRAMVLVGFKPRRRSVR
jgi:hypothetical protein